MLNPFLIQWEPTDSYELLDCTMERIVHMACNFNRKIKKYEKRSDG